MKAPLSDFDSILQRPYLHIHVVRTYTEKLASRSHASGLHIVERCLRSTGISVSTGTTPRDVPSI